MSDSRELSDGTRVVHAGLPAAADGEPFLPGPTFAAPFHLAGNTPMDAPFQYGRYGNPTWARFEEAAPSHAAVISWIAADGLSHEEIAQLLDRSPGATREFISQCRKRARVHLGEWYEMAFGKDAP